MSSPESDFIYSSARSSYRPAENTIRTKKRRFDNSREMTYGVDSYSHGEYKSYRPAKNEPREHIVVSNLPVHANDSNVKEGLFHEFKKFGHVSIYLLGRGENRTATISYKHPDDVLKVKQYYDRRGKFIVFDRQVHVDFETEFERSNERSFSPADSYSSVSPRRNINRSTGRTYKMKEDFGREPRFESTNSYRGRDQNYLRNQPKRYSYDNYREGGNIPVEDDPKASRTLFVGNLEPSVSAQELRRIFEAFGHVEDVEIKRPAHSHGSTYAFVKFLDIDVAAKAKSCVDGQYIGQNSCRIGYGRSMPSTRLWVGGLGSWTSIEDLTREFDRFGAIKFIDFQKGNNYAYVLYDSLDAACVAAREMHGYPLGGQNRRLKIDFASPEKTRSSNQFDQYNDFDQPNVSYERESSGRGRTQNHWERRGGRNYNRDRRFHHREEGKWFNSHNDSYSDNMTKTYHASDREVPRNREPSLSEDERIGRKRTRSGSPFRDNVIPQRSKRHDSLKGHKRHSSTSRKDDDFVSNHKHHHYDRLSVSPSRSGKRNSSSSLDRESKISQPETSDNNISRKSPVKSLDADTDKKPKQENGSEVTNRLESVADVAKRFAVAWRGAFALKTSAFPLRMHLVGGNPELADALLRAVGQGKILSISQRLRLDQPKLEEVSRRVINAGASGHCILLALPIAQTGWEDLELDKSFQLRNLRSLVVYLKQKQAAGVIPLLTNDANAGSKDDTGILHAFPPCDYSHQHLLKVAPNLGPEPSKEDHLVMILVRGGA